MFELHYEYICSAGWKETKVKTLNNYDELDAALEDCKKNGYTILDNPMCRKCKKFPNDCAGTRNHIWDGCVYQEKE